MDIIDIIILAIVIFLGYRGLIQPNKVLDAYFIIERLVESAEQRFKKPKSGNQKLNYVLEQLYKFKIKIDPELALDFIESAVNNLK